MTLPRTRLVSLEATPYYHCVSRCVRRAFLCGFDRQSARSFEHRRRWIEDRLHKLAEIFAIDLCAYSVMSNHYHVVLRIDDQRVRDWTMHEVIERWSQLYNGPDLVAKYQSKELLSEAELEVVNDTVECWRQRLTDISWFMRCVNEHIARKSNAEDCCKGRFWEGRFKSQALLDVHALLQCMAYVDLNPIRAAMANTPEASDHTSIQARIQDRERSLMPFDDQTQEDIDPLPFGYRDYLKLVDWTGRAIREDKRGAIPEDTPPILNRMSITPKSWTRTTKHYGRWTYRAVGTAESLGEAAREMGQRWFRGVPLDEVVTT